MNNELQLFDSSNAEEPTTASKPSSRWDRQWAVVPALWRTGLYRLDQPPFNEVFSRNTAYLQSTKEHDFRPRNTAPRIGNEVAWWIWTCWNEGWRKIEPSMLRWWAEATTELAERRQLFTGSPLTSISELDPAAVTATALDLFQTRNSRHPSSGNTRNLRSIAEHVHLLVSARCTGKPWWEADRWNIRADPRIPHREHEPCADQAIIFTNVKPRWLREGIRFWLRQMITYEQFTWTTAGHRAQYLSNYFGEFCQEYGISHPAIAADPHDIHSVFTSQFEWLRSPERSPHAKTIERTTAAAAQSHIQAFYDFMIDNKTAAAKATGDPRWLDLTAEHSRLWPHPLRVRRTNTGRTPGGSEQKWMSAADLELLVCHLPVLSTPTNESVAISLPDGSSTTYGGRGDAPGMRVWLIQAMTGRRVSEILMLDFNPLTMLHPPSHTADADPDAFVARLRYQQTKVEGLEPTIMVEQAVVDLIDEQQRYVREKYPEAITPPYLFPAPRHNHRGTQARTRSSMQGALRRLDKQLQLTDQSGRPLRFSSTHRLRHTRATELLNAGVPQHVVQRYLGHRSPEMTMHYAATLSQTAENEFLKYKKIGIDGKELGLSPQDVYDMTMINKRTDRILPNGVCLLPPAKTCDKGNACLSCGHFATDRRHIEDLREQREQTVALIEMRREQYRQRTGQELGDENIWITGRHAEITVLDSIVDRLESESENTSVSGPGVGNRTRLPITPVTHGAHHQLLANGSPAPTPPTTK